MPPTSELDNLRKVAKDWLTAMTSLFGLFSLASIVFAAESIKDLDGGSLVVFIASAIVAVLAAASAVGAGSVAATGWPKPPPKKNNGRLLDWTQDLVRVSEENAQRDAVRALRFMVVAAAVALVALVVAVGALWYDQAHQEPISVRISTTSGDTTTSVACGGLQKSDSKNLVVRDASGKDQTHAWTSTTTIEVVEHCP